MSVANRLQQIDRDDKIDKTEVLAALLVSSFESKSKADIETIITYCKNDFL